MQQQFASCTHPLRDAGKAADHVLVASDHHVAQASCSCCTLVLSAAQQACFLCHKGKHTLSTCKAIAEENAYGAVLWPNKLGVSY